MSPPARDIKAEARQAFARAGIPFIGPDDAPWRASLRGGAAPRNGPPPTPEPAGPPYFDLHYPAVMIDRYALNPGVEFVRALPMPANPHAGEPPTMFATGDLPVFTASGIEVDRLLWVPWKLRHAAALSPSRGLVLRMVEEADTPDDLQTPEGRAALAEYFDRVRRWALTEPPPVEPDEAEIASLFGPQGG